jgi:uncharacterized protein YciI
MGSHHPHRRHHGKLMPFAIIAHDAPGAAALRAQLRQQHVDYLRERVEMILAGGALLDESGRPVGGLLIIDTDDRQAAEAFSAEDPFCSGGVFGTVEVVPWRKTFFDGKTLA